MTPTVEAPELETIASSDACGTIPRGPDTCAGIPCAVETVQPPHSRAPDATRWILAAALGLFAVLAWPLLRGEVYVADDLGEFHLPVRAFYAQQLQHGEAFDWMPTLYGGFYIAGEGQLGGYHPWHWVLYRTLPLGWAFDLEVLASYVLMFLGSFCFLNRLVARRDAAWLGALVFTLGGFSLLHFVHPNAIAVVAHLPWLLVALDVILCSGQRSSRAWAGAALALLIGSQLLLGYPQYVWFSSLALAAYAGVRVAAGSPIGRLGPAVVAVGLGVLLGAAQWLPTWHVLGQSVRQQHDATFTATGSLHPLNAVQLVAPYMFQTRVVGQNTHELGLYLGAVPAALLVWLLSQSPRWGRQKPAILATLGLALGALLLAAGEFGPLFWMQQWLPVVNRFRFPARAIVLVQLALTVGAVLACGLLLGGRPASESLRRRGTRWLLVLVALSTTLAAFGPLVWPQNVATPALVWAGPGLIALAALLVTCAARGSRWAVALLAPFIAIDLGVYGLSYAVIGRTATLAEYTATSPHAPHRAPARVVAPHEAGPRVGNRMLLAGATRIDGYAGLEPAKRLDYREPFAWKLAGAEFVYVRPVDLPEKRCQWIKLASTAPRARLVTRTIELAELPAGYQADAAVAELPAPLPRSEPGKVNFLADRPGHIHLHAHAPARQLLVTTESFDSGWRVLIDGQPAPIVRVNGDFLGCTVEPGAYDVQFDFAPACRTWGLSTSGCGLGFLVAALVWGLVGPRRRPPGKDRP